MAQALRLESVSKHVNATENRNIVYNGFVSILPDSRGNRLTNFELVMCEALVNVINNGSKNIDPLQECEIRSLEK